MGTYAVNLLPAELCEKPPDMRRLARVAVLAVTAVILGVVSLGLGWQIRASQAGAARLQAELQQLQPRVQEVDRLAAEAQAFQAENQALAGLMQRDILWHKLLRKIGDSTPPKTWFTDIATGEDGRTLTLSGMTPEAEEVGLFLQAARSISEVTGLKLLSLEQVEEGGVRLVKFKVEACIKRQPQAGATGSGDKGGGAEGKQPGAAEGKQPEAGGEATGAPGQPGQVPGGQGG